MKKYKALEIVYLNEGHVTLDADQARRRNFGAFGRHEIVKPICFKAGEIFVYDGQVPKRYKVEVIEDETTLTLKKRGRPKKEAA